MQKKLESTAIDNQIESAEADQQTSLTVLEVIVRLAEQLESSKQIPYFLSVLFLSAHLIAPAFAEKVWHAFQHDTVAVHSQFFRSQRDVLSGQSSHSVFDVEIADKDSVEAPQKILGTQNWVSLLCSYADIPEHSFPKEHYEQLNQQFKDYWKENSYDSFEYNGLVLAGPYMLPGTEQDYNSSQTQDVLAPLIDCIKAANPDVDFTQFDGINAFFSGKLFGHSYGGGVTMTLDGERKRWAVTWLSPHDQMFSTGVHEQGHGFWLEHSLAGDDEYGNPYDNMSISEGQHTIGYNKWKLGWLQARSVEPGKTEDIELPAISSESSLIVLVSPLDSTVEYSIEYRNAENLDENTPAPPGVVVHQILRDVDNEGTETEKIILVTDAALSIGESWRSLDEQPITLCVTGESGKKYLVTVANGVSIDCSHQFFHEMFLPRVRK